MTDTNITPANAHLVEIDDSRVKEFWQRQHRRQMWMIGGAAAVAALMATAICLFALRPPGKAEPAVINMPPITVNYPGPQAGPTTTKPNLQQLPGESSPPVFNYTLFTKAQVNGKTVVSGWVYDKSGDARPAHQFCYVELDRTTTVYLAQEALVLPSMEADAQKVGLSATDARRYMQSCRWYEAELRDPAK